MIHKKFKHIKTVNDISEYELKSNGLKVLYKNIPDTGVVTTNIVYLVGSRDESVGETGVAHMLEHMLFKPTKQDKKNKHDSSAMKFEREVGAVLNANTWKDRTSYYFSYGIEHFPRVLKIEAERMRDVLLTDIEFQPERTNVLSEFDMYNGEPEFALSVAMACTAFHSHPYGHETIGFREDIEIYTVEKLQRFYNHFYRPNNATLMVVGDIDLSEALDEIAKAFGDIEPESNVKIRPEVIEPVQEGLRRVEIVRPGSKNILSFGIKHEGFPTQDWFENLVVLRLLAGNADSLLNKALVDTGLASTVSYSQEPTKDKNIAMLSITLSQKINHEEMEKRVFQLISEVKEDWLKKHLKTVVTCAINSELFSRDSSLDIVGELTEYISAGNWSAYFETEQILRKITVKQIKKKMLEMFNTKSLTIGVYKSI
jgi:zinc protease